MQSVEAVTVGKYTGSIKTLLRKALKDLGASRASLMVYDHREKVFKIELAASINPEEVLNKDIVKNTRVKLGEGISGSVAVTKKPLLINEIEELRRKFPDIKTETEASNYKSSLVIPIVEKERTVAVLNINDKMDGGKFNQDHLHLAEVLAEYCAIALKAERLNESILHVNEIIREISLTNSLDEVYSLVVNKGAEILYCKDASLMLVEKGTDGEMYLIVKESTDRAIIGERRLLGESVSGYVWKTGEPILIKSVEDGIRDRRFKILNKPGSFIVVPLNLKYQTPYALNVALKSVSTIGVLNFTHPVNNDTFTEEQLEAIINYSNLVAIAIEKARFYNDSKKAYLSTVRSLSAALESKDLYTKGHSDSVELICSMIAERMGFDEKQKEDLQIAAMLHDIGKIGIPESILNKKGTLDDDEYKRIQTHIEEAENILKHTFYLDNSLAIIRTHHEHYDGSGYPGGLKADEIPIGGRILSTVDAFHAMTSNRPYRKAMDIVDVKAELVRCRGKQFDPDITDLLLELIPELFPEASGGKGANA